MKRFLLSSAAASVVALTSVAAQAADLPRRAYTPPPVVAPLFSWTGFYVGANIGGAWADTDITNGFTGTTWSPSGSSFIGGGQVGYNWQFNGPWVIGVEWDFDWSSSGSNSVRAQIPGGNIIEANINPQWMTTVAGRFGYAVDTWLFYVKGGGGWVNTDFNAVNVTTGASTSGSKTASGWLVGVGVEYAFSRNWSAKLEYDYLGLSSWSNPGNIIVPDQFVVDGHVQTFKAGINYRFGTY